MTEMLMLRRPGLRRARCVEGVVDFGFAQVRA
jgi:hypothetical protein